MKIINCDLCKKDMGRNVGLYSITMPKYQSSEFDSGFYMKPERGDADICLECWNKIAEAQNKVIEETLSTH